jgi:hypothetical protein
MTGSGDEVVAGVWTATVLTRGLVENHLSAIMTWSGPTGSRKERTLSHQASNRLLLALRNSSVERDQIEVEGDLLLGDISRRPRFAIRSDDGAELRGSVPPTVARSQVRGWQWAIVCALASKSSGDSDLRRRPLPIGSCGSKRLPAGVDPSRPDPSRRPGAGGGTRTPNPCGTGT